MTPPVKKQRTEAPAPTRMSYDRSGELMTSMLMWSVDRHHADQDRIAAISERLRVAEHQVEVLQQAHAHASEAARDAQDRLHREITDYDRLLSLTIRLLQETPQDTQERYGNWLAALMANTVIDLTADEEDLD